MVPSRDIAALIASLDDGDPARERSLRDALSRAAAEPDALPVLVEALTRGPAEQRKAASFLLRLHGRNKAALRALCDALADPEPKVRRNAAVSIGHVAQTAGSEAAGVGAAVPRLVAALERETPSWVRPSLILALGAIDDPAAHDALRALNAAPLGPVEQDVLRKALARSARSVSAADGQSTARSAEWRAEGAGLLPLLLDVPLGFEAIALEEATERGVGGLTDAGPGRLRCSPGTDPGDVFPALRCVYRLLIEAGEGPPLDPTNEAALANAIALPISRSSLLRDIRAWLNAEPGPIQFRLALEGSRVPRETQRRVLQAIRPAAAQHGLVDSPSDYVIQLVISVRRERTALLVAPSFVPDDRFAYRQRDVGASINPVVGACLARLVRAPKPPAPGEKPIVFDPTCGSGTLLIERALLDPDCRLRGLDVSPTAIEAARQNVRAAGLGQRVHIQRGDAANPDSWPHCDEVLANLPFGLRTGRHDRDLPALYAALAQNLARALRPGGGAVLYTAQSKLLEHALLDAHLTPTTRIRTTSGGVNVTVLCVQSRSETVLG